MKKILCSSTMLIEATCDFFIQGERQLKIIRDVINRCWPKQLEYEKNISPECVEYKLNGHPFNLHDNTASSLAVNRIYDEIIRNYYKLGWRVSISGMVWHKWLQINPLSAVW